MSVVFTPLYTKKIDAVALVHVPDVSEELAAILYASRALFENPVCVVNDVQPAGKVGNTVLFLRNTKAIIKSPATCAGRVALLTPVADPILVIDDAAL